MKKIFVFLVDIFSKSNGNKLKRNNFDENKETKGREEGSIYNIFF